MDEFNPRELGDRAPMLRGRSAAYIMALSARMAILVGFSIGVAVVLVMLLGEELTGRSIFGFMVAVLLLLFIATGVVHTAGKVKEAREVHAGYTTIMRSHGNVDQIDPSSGRVVRLAGDPFLKKDQYETRIARIEASGSRGDVSGAE